MPDKTITIQPSSIETIDMGLYNWVNDTLDLATNTNDGYKKTPVLWLGTERSYQIKNDKQLRDKVGRLKLPLITINRESMAKDPNFKGAVQANLIENPDYKGGTVLVIAKRIQQEKTRNFANADKSRELKTVDGTGYIDNKKVVYQEISIPVPTYVTVMYSITLRTEYQQQMNDLLQPFIATTGGLNSFLFKHEGNQYEAFIQQDFAYNKNTTNLAEGERMFETKVSIKVLGYLVGEGSNREKPKVTIRETQVEVRISRERVIVGDKIPWKIKNKDYRE